MKKDLIVDVGAFGGLPFYALVLLLAYITNHIQLLTQVFAALVFSYAVAVVLRLAFFRERPEKRKHKNILEKIDAGSFPSLHVTRGTALAIIGGAFYNNMLVWVLFVIVILAIAHSRVWRKQHRMSDVIAGIILGILVALATLYLF